MRRVDEDVLEQDWVVTDESEPATHLTCERVGVQRAGLGCLETWARVRAARFL